MKNRKLYFIIQDNAVVMLDESLLQKPIDQLYLSASFKEMASRHDFKKLQDVLNWPVNVLLMHDGFTYHHYQELRKFLIPFDGIHLLKTTRS